MRKVVSISLPEKMVKGIKIIMEEEGFATFSEFIRHLIRLWHEEKLYQDVMESEREITRGEYVEKLDD